jgi:hypothetical protein
LKHLLSGVALIVALAFSAPVGAQPANPSGGNAMGMPGPNPGGAGLTPYTSGPPRPAAVPPPSAAALSAAAPPRPVRPSSHGKMAGRHGKGARLPGDIADQLNQEELARLRAGNFSNLPRPAGPPERGIAPPPTGSGRMPAGLR